MENGLDLCELGQRLKSARVEAQFSQADLSERAHISITQLSAYENGKKSIGLASLAKIAEATGKTIDQLYRGPLETRPINEATNNGELVANCIVALCDSGVIALGTAKKRANEDDHMSHDVCVVRYETILKDLVYKIIDFEENKNDYPDPVNFKKQIVAAAAKKINNEDNDRFEEEYIITDGYF